MAIADLHRGVVLTDDPAVVSSDRILVRLGATLPDRARLVSTSGPRRRTRASVAAAATRSSFPTAPPAAIVRLATPLAVAPGDRLVLRGTSGTDRIVGAMVLDVAPPRGISRRRQTAERVGRLADAVLAADAEAYADARLDLHGVLEPTGGGAGRSGSPPTSSRASTRRSLAVADAADGVAPLTDVRATAARALRRQATIGRSASAASRLGPRRPPRRRRPPASVSGPASRLRDTESTAEPDPVLTAAMDRLIAALSVAAPPPLAEAARAAACPDAGIRELERTGRIVVLEPDLAYAAATYDEITATAVSLAATAPLTPATLRDATGTSRKYVMAILEDLDRRAILRRTRPATSRARARGKQR